MSNSPRFTGGTIDRRGFLAFLSGLAAAGCASSNPATQAGGDDSEGETGKSDTATTQGARTATADLSPPESPFTTDPFTLGVASGDPIDTSVILWTRLAVDPVDATATGTDPVEVMWEIATDDAFTDVVANGIVEAVPRYAHSLHIDAGGLTPATIYYYRFRIGDFTSAVGTTRTTPEPTAAAESLRIAVASCQSWQAGYYNCYEHMASEDLDFVLFVGDYIYEYGDSGDEVRPHGTPEVDDLDEYRNRYGLYRTDPQLQKAHASFPWVVTWDDHEVENNYAGETDENGTRPDIFLKRRAAAYQAYYEHMPLRLPPPNGPDFEIQRKVQWGDLATFLVLDTRQFRDAPVCSTVGNLPVADSCEAMQDTTRTMLGNDQLVWMARELTASSTTWNALAQQVVMTPIQIPFGEQTIVNNDQWDGYPAERQRVLDALVSSRANNPVVLTGDIHLAAVGNLVSNPNLEGSEVIASEFVCPGITSPFPADLRDLVGSTYATADNVLFTEADHRGYMSCTITRDQWRTEFRFVEAVDTEGAALLPATPGWVVTAGTPGAIQA